MSELSPATRKRRYFSDGSQVVHKKTIQRRSKVIQSGLNEQMQYLLEESSSESKINLPEDAHYTLQNSAVNHNFCTESSFHVEQEQQQNILCYSEKSDNCDEIPEINEQTTQVQATLDEISDVSYSSEGEISDATTTKLSSLEHTLEDKQAESALNHPSTATSSNASPTNIDTEYFQINALKEYILNNGDIIMFQESGLKIWEVILVILGISTRFNLSYLGRRALIEAAKVFAGPDFANWDISDYYLSKMFDPPGETITYHFYCDVCYRELETCSMKKKFKKHKTICQQCLKDFELSMDAPNRFISIDIKYQIASLLKMTDVRDGLFSNLNHINPVMRSTDLICDVYDGLLYKKVVPEYNEHSVILTLNFATDGAPLHNSSKTSFWPILGFINELPPKLRFKYPLLMGLSLTKSEPTPKFMNIFMKPYVLRVNELGNIGFNLNINGKIMRFFVKSLICFVDSVARPLLQNRMQYNSGFGCSWCYIVGIHKYGSIRFLLEAKESSLRSHICHLKDMDSVTKILKSIEQKVESKNDSPCEDELPERNRDVISRSSELKKKKSKKEINEKGVKGFSILTELENIDMVWSFSRDYLHADLLGVTSFLWSIWTSRKSTIHLTVDKQIEVNKRLIQMTPPQEIHRLVRPLAKEKSKWKASEWRSWLLFYAIPCLRGILDPYALQHFSLYVRSIYTLLKTNISKEELDRADYDLAQFVYIFEILYGEKCMRFNVHTAKHVVQCVKESGPLWATSTFPSENAIYYLKQCVHGPKGVYEQMAKKTLQRNVSQGLISELDASDSVAAFCNQLFSRQEVSSFSRSEDVVLIGKGLPDKKYNIAWNTGEVLTFKRCIFSRMVINSTRYESPIKTNDTVFRLDNGMFVQVLNLLKCSDIAFAEVNLLEVKAVVLGKTIVEKKEHLPVIDDVVVNHLFEVSNIKDNILIRVNALKEKCVLINTGHETYVSTMPNTIEIQ